MTSSQATRVADMLDAFARGDIDTMLTHYSPEVVVSPPHGLPYSQQRTGVPQFLEMLGEMTSLLDLALGEYRVRDAGDAVVVTMTMTFTGKGTGSATTTDSIEVYTFNDDDLICGISVFYKDVPGVAGVLTPVTEPDRALANV